MNCPNCKTEMKEGKVIYDGNIWQEGKISKTWGFAALSKGEKIIFCRCPKCGKIELTSEIK